MCACTALHCVQWLSAGLVPAMQEAEAAGGLQVDAAAEGGGGRLQAFIATIIGNLELRISNVHIRRGGVWPGTGGDAPSSRGQGVCEWVGG